MVHVKRAQLPGESLFGEIHRLLRCSDSAVVIDGEGPGMASTAMPLDPVNLLLGRRGECRGMAGMRKSHTIVEEDGSWIRGHDGAYECVSVALGRELG